MSFPVGSEVCELDLLLLQHIFWAARHRSAGRFAFRLKHVRLNKPPGWTWVSTPIMFFLFARVSVVAEIRLLAKGSQKEIGFSAFRRFQFQVNSPYPEGPSASEEVDPVFMF